MAQNLETLKQMYDKLIAERTKLQSKIIAGIVRISKEQMSNSEIAQKRAGAFEYLEAIAHPERWVAYGIVTTEEFARYTFIEHQLDPNDTEFIHPPRYMRNQ